MIHKQKCFYTALGALIMLIGMGIGAMVSPPLIAQRGDVLGEIQCTGLTVMFGKLNFVVARTEKNRKEVYLMLKRRFLPYIVGICIVALLFLSYVGYIAYRNHVEYKRLMSNAQAFYPSIEEQHDHTHHGEGADVASYHEKTGPGEQIDSGEEHPYFVGRTPDGGFSYNIAGRLYASNEPMSPEVIEMYKWIHTGKMSPVVEEQFRLHEMFREQDELNVVQRVVTPDGKLHKVIVARDSQYEEGDAILPSELDPAILEVTDGNRKSWQNIKLTVDDVDYSPPEAYYSIEDPYKSEEYFNKFVWSIENNVSMAEVEKKVTKGELDFSLSEEAKRHVDQKLTMMERSKMLAPEIPPLSDKLPVKIRYLPDGGEDTLPGWMRKLEGTLSSGSSEAVSDGDYSATDPFSEGSINEDASGASVRSDVPVSPSSLSDMIKPTPSPQSVVDIEKQLTPQGIEAELSDGLPTAPADKAQQLIDEYGTEEGLRRLRETDPDAARRFERERRGAPSRDVPKADDYSDDQPPDDSP